MTSFTKNADGTTTRTGKNGVSVTLKNGKPVSYSTSSSSSSSSSNSGSSSSSSKSSSSGNSVTQTSTPTSSNSAGSKSSSPSSQSISSSQPSVYTAQPTYVSAGSGGSTYLITREDGSTNQIAASGISLAETSKYYADKAAQAEAKGDLKSAQKYAQSASDFAAAANYESNSGLTNTYGKSTGITYDATASVTPNNSSYSGLTVKDTAVKYQAGNGLTGSTPTETLAPMEVASALGGIVLHSPSLDGKTPGESSVMMPNQSGTIGTGHVEAYVPDTESGQSESGWDWSKNIFDNLASVGNSFVENGQKQMDNYQESLKTNDTYNSFMQTGSDLVDAFGNLPETLMNSGTLAGAVGGFAATALLPNDLVKTIKKVSDGNAEDISGWDIAYSAADVLGLIPFVGLPFKAVKAAVKGTKVAGALSGGLTLGTSVTETIATDGDNDKPVQNAKLTYNGNGVYSLEGADINSLIDTTIANRNSQLLANALDTAATTGEITQLPWLTPTETAWVSEIDRRNATAKDTNNPTAADTPTQNPTTPQNHTQPEQNTEYDLSSLQDSITKLFAGAGGSSGNVVGGGGNPMVPYYIAGESGGGSGDVTVVTNGAQPAQPVDYSGVFQYIVPVAIIIGIIIVAVALVGSKKKRGASA